MARPRRTISHSNRASSRGEQDLSALSSEVLKLRLQALNLPITGSKGQLLNRLKRALQGQGATLTTAQPKRVSKAKARKAGRPATRTTTVTGRSLESLSANLGNVNEDNVLSDRTLLSSIEDMIESDPEPDECNFQWNTGFSQTQRPVTMVRKKKPVIDTFPKWLDAFMTYMLILVNAYPRRALELIKYQQIISRAVAKFKGLAWLSYNQQFHRRAAYDLSLS